MLLTSSSPAQCHFFQGLLHSKGASSQVMWATIPTSLSPATRQISFILQFFMTTGYSTLTWRFWILFSEDYLKQKGERNGRNRSLHALLVACPELKYSCTQASKCLLLSASFLTIAVQLVRNSLVFRFAVMSILVLCKLEQDFKTKQEPCSASLTSDMAWAERIQASPGKNFWTWVWCLQISPTVRTVGLIHTCSGRALSDGRDMMLAEDNYHHSALAHIYHRKRGTQICQG